MLEYDKVSDACIDGLARYLMFGDPLGGFLEAVISNQLMQAAVAADDQNQSLMSVWGAVLYQLPNAAYGSEDKIRLYREERREVPANPRYFTLPTQKWVSMFDDAWKRRRGETPQ